MPKAKTVRPLLVPAPTKGVCAADFESSPPLGCDQPILTLG